MKRIRALPTHRERRNFGESLLFWFRGGREITHATPPARLWRRRSELGFYQATLKP